MIRILALIFILCCYSILNAQNGGFAGSFGRMGLNPRAMAMGNAVHAADSTLNFGFYNPALAALNTHTSVEISSSRMSFDRSLNTISSSFQLPPSAGLSLSLIHGNVRDIDGRTLSGYPTELFSTNEFLLHVAFGVRASEKLSLGAAVRVYRSYLHPDIPESRGTGFDLGMHYKASHRYSASLVVKDLLANLEWDTRDFYNAATQANKSDEIPTALVVANQFSLTPALMFSAEFETRFQQSQWRSSSSFLEFEEGTSYSQMLRFGTQYRLHERIITRFGLESSDMDLGLGGVRPSAGFSLLLPFDRYSPSINYAFTREYGGFSYMHAFSISLNL